MRVPVSTPAGTFTLSDRSLLERPWPPQFEQGLLITWPIPEQLGQVRSTVKKPCEARTLPIPEQVGQVLGSDPPAAPLPLQGLHCTEVGTLMDFCNPE